MDSPFSSSLAQLNPQPNIQKPDNTSREFHIQPNIRPPDNTSREFQIKPDMEMPNNTSQQCQKPLETTCRAELEAKIASLQAELDLLKSTKPQPKQNSYELIYENELLKVDLEKARECLRIMLKHVEDRDEEIAKLKSLLGTEEKEKEIDRKGKKVVDIDKPREKQKGKSLIYFTKGSTGEVLDIMPCSDSSDDSEEEEEEVELEKDEEEEYFAQLKRLLKMGRLDGVGSSSKTGSGSVEVNDMDCIQSNDLIKPLSKEISRSEKDLIPKYLNFGEITSWGKKLYGPNNNEVPQLMRSSERRSKPTIEIHEIEESNENEAKLTGKKRKLGVHWESEEEMLCAMTSSPGILLEAVCALYRQERKRRLCRTQRMDYKGLSDSDYQQVMSMAVVLMEGDQCGPNKKTNEELEAYFKGGLDRCARLVSTYSTQLFNIYSRALDPHFC